MAEAGRRIAPALDSRAGSVIVSAIQLCRPGATTMNIEVARRTVASSAALANGSPRDVRLACRGGAFSGQTSGLAPGHVQGNLAILPQSLAADFLRFCHKNPKPCPVIGVAEPAIRTCRSSAPISISAPTCHATGCGRTACFSRSRPTSRRGGATTSSPS
jgi:hypothetical protein